MTRKKVTTNTAIIAIALLSFIFSSCGGSGNKPLSIRAYHEKVIPVFNAASEKMATEREIIFESKLSKEENLALVEGLQKSVDDAVKMMNEVNYPAEAEAFHQQLMSIYAFETETIIPLLSETLTLEPKSKEWYKVWREIDKQNKTVDKMLDKLGQLQRDLQRAAQNK